MARDLDRLRTALGDDTLSYVGYSYGTVIGAVYAQMFPERVGRMVLDSPVDLSASALEELRGNSAGFEQALDDFLAGLRVTRLVRVPREGRPRRRAHQARSSVRAGSAAPDRQPRHREADVEAKAGVAAFYTALISALYDKQYGWPALAACTARRRARRRLLAALPRRLVQRAAGRRLLRQHQRGHRRDPVRRP